MPPITRSRSTTFPMGRGHSVRRRISDDVVLADRTEDLGEIVGTQTTVSEGHPYSQLSKAGNADIGGDFFTQKTYVVGSNKTVHLQADYDGDHVTYDGPMYPAAPSQLVFPSPNVTSTDDIDELGATAIARCEPTNSAADAGTFLGELLKDGIPSLLGVESWKERTHLARGAGKEFLNTEFGWMPLVRDVRSISNAIHHANTVLAQYERNSGRPVRRRYSFPVQRERSVIDGLPPYGTAYYVPEEDDLNDPLLFGTMSRFYELERRQWFSGSFMYHLPSGYDSRNKMDRIGLKAKQVLGLTLSPEVLWNIAPWSWAVDWFSNAGDVIHNISHYAENGLVMQYGYMMEHTIVKHTYTRSPLGFKSTGVLLPPLTLVTETKTRRRANPFGFGIAWNGLSPFQLAIAAALGLSRS